MQEPRCEYCISAITDKLQNRHTYRIYQPLSSSETLIKALRSASCEHALLSLLYRHPGQARWRPPRMCTRRAHTHTDEISFQSTQATTTKIVVEPRTPKYCPPGM